MFNLIRNKGTFFRRMIVALTVVVFIFTILLPTSTSIAANTLPMKPITGDELATLVDSLVKQQVAEHNLPNATVAVVYDGQVVYTQGHGNADLPNKTPVIDEETLFRIGSTSKVFTWIAVMQLVEAGKLDLHTDINEYLDFEIPATTPITLFHLMTHTAGFEDVMENLFSIDEDRYMSLEKYIKNRIPAVIFPTGEIMAYSNYGTTLAGYIVERVSGMPYEEYVNQHIFKPLEMNMSTFSQPLPDALAKQMTKAYRHVDGIFLERGFELMPGPAGGMSTTASDMAKFMIAQLKNTNMHKHQLALHPLLDGMAHGFMESTINGQRVLMHHGSTMLFDSGMYLVPDHNLGFFISYSGGNYLIHTEIFQTLMDTYFFPTNFTLNDQYNVAELNKRASQYVGEYHMGRKSITTSDRILSLVMGVISVKKDDIGFLQVTHFGETNTFVEIEPGIYRNLREGRSSDPFGQFRTIVFDTDSNGNTILLTDGAMTYLKTPWYATQMFTIGTLAISILFVIGSLLYWIFTYLLKMIRRFLGQSLAENQNIESQGPSKRTIVSSVATGVAIVFGASILLMLLGFLSGSEMDPVYQMPTDVYDPAGETLLDTILSVVILISGILIPLLAIWLWLYRYWRLARLIHYTLYAIVALMLLWSLTFWNIL